MKPIAHAAIRSTTWSLALILALCAAWPGPPAANAAALPIPAGLTVEQDDRNAILQWDFDPQNPVAPLPAGVAGYKITWGPAGQPDAFSKLTEERIIQLQPLTNGQPYVARVQSIDSAGHLSAASPSISFAGSPARVDALRARMNGFFDDFNLPQGAPDERRWNSAYSRCNADWSNGFFINDQFHAHNTVFSGNCDRAQSISRPRAVLDFSDNGTRTITFDFDGEFRRGQWYLDLVPRLMDISGQVNIEGSDGVADPANGLRFHQNEQSLNIDAFGPSGALTIPASTDGNPYPPLDWAGLKQVSNVRRHWEIHVGRDQAEVLINGKTVLKTAPGAFHLTQDRYYLLWNVFSYNTEKANVPFVLAHWDNFGFDAPAGTTHDTVTHNYRLVNTGTDFMVAFGDQAPARATLNIPDTVDGANARRLMFTLQMDQNDQYDWSPNDNVVVNGVAFAIPKPTSNATPALSLQDIVNTYSPYTVVIDLPPGVLKQGANQISFNTMSSSVHNIHVELDFAAASEPPYTPPAQAIGGTLIPAIPAVGPNAVLTRIGAKQVDTSAENLTDPAVFNPTVSGIVPIGVEVHQDIALQATGSNVGVRQLELLIDRRVALTQRVDAQAAAPGVVTTLNLDTRGLSNGTHEIYFRAYNTRCTPSIPDYFHGIGAESGAYFPLHIKVQNSGAAGAAAPSLANQVLLPLVTSSDGSSLPNTCVVAAAQTATAPLTGTTPSFAARARDAVRDDQRVLICDL
ncbi:MAG TPA: hypothetical protein VF897_05385 [Roseiflexaceae bacterium]